MESTHRRTALEGVATLAVVAVALLLFAAAPALAVTPTFATPAGFAVGDSPHAIVTGDFNRDGRPDVAVADSGSDTVSILLGLGNGKLAAAKSIKVGTQPTGVAVADFNGDGKLDLAVANSGSNTVSILRGNGAGGFTLVQSIAVGAGPMSIAAGDFNHDGRCDLVVTCYTAQCLCVLMQDSAGRFVASRLAAPTRSSFQREGPRAIAVADVDHDGNLDIVFTTSFVKMGSYSENLAVYYGDGSGAFDTTQPTLTVPDGVMDLSVFTSNGPAARASGTSSSAAGGLSEIVGASWTTDKVWDMVQAGARTFSAPATLVDNVGYPGSLVVGDFNGDRIPDIAVTLPQRNEVQLTVSRAGKPYQTKLILSVGERPGPMVAADMNRDGTDDLVVGDYGANKVEVLTRTSPLRTGAGFEPYVESSGGTASELSHLAVGDLNGDGQFDAVSTLSSFLGSSDGTFGAPLAHAAGDDVCLADVNSDGIADLVSTDTADDQVSIALGAGDGSFVSPTSFATGVGPTRLVVADLNGDGKPDIATTNADGTVSILLGDGAGSFVAQPAVTVGASPQGIAVGDFNRDGKLDLAVANSGGSTVSVLLGSGTGAFSTTDVTVGAAPEAVAVGDFNRDGKLDLVVGTASGSVSVLLGDGAGGFGSPATVHSPAGATQLVVGDFTTDGKLDVAATTAHTGGAYGVSLLSGNGAGSLATALNLTVPGNNVSAIAAADFNHDGALDLLVGGADASAPAQGALYEFVNDTFAPATNVGVTGDVYDGTSVYWVPRACTVILDPIDDGAGMSAPPSTWFRYGTAGFVRGTRFTVAAPADHSNDGVKSFRVFSVDRVGNVEDWLEYSIGVDTVKPSLSDDASSGWTNDPVTEIALAAHDTGSGLSDDPLQISGWGYSLETVPTAAAATVTVPAPYDHTNDGVHTFTFKQHDNVGNGASKTFVVRIDTVRPTVSVSAASMLRYGPSIRYRVLDGSNGCGASVVKLVVFNHHGAKVDSWALGTVKTGVWNSIEFPAPSALGTYTCRFYATDLAGNVQQKVGQTTFTVR